MKANGNMSLQVASGGNGSVNGTHRRGLDLTFRTKLLLGMCGLVLLTGVVVVFVADRGNRAGTQSLVDAMFQEVSRHAVTQTKDFVLRAEPVARSLEQLSRKDLAMDDMNRLAPQLLAFLIANPGLTWVLYGNESGDHTGATRMRDGSVRVVITHLVNGRTQFTEYQILNDGTWQMFSEDDNHQYDPRTRPFYLLAKQTGKLSWSPPYMFFTQGVPGISCVVPIQNASGQLHGVFSVEFDLNALSEFVGGLSLSQHSRVFIFTPDQTLLAHPDLRNLEGIGINGRGKMLTLADTGDPLVEAFRHHLSAEYLSQDGGDAFHFFQFKHDGVNYMASTTVFSIDGGQSWVVGAIAPESDFLSGVWRTRWLALAATAATLGIAAVAAGLLARRISRPVHSMIGFMHRVGAGDLQARADFPGGREFRQMSSALNQMIGDLRERLQLLNSLQVAMEVQQSLLPQKDPTCANLDIAGRSHYCDNTGGDYFDFVDVTPISESSLLIAVGDVMGHGIAAALLMASARAALRTRIIDRPTLGGLMVRINQVLASNNRQCRFMTLALLMIDGRSGAITWASAGHDPAIVYNAQSDEFRELEGGEIPLGVMEGAEYQEYSGGCLCVGNVLAIATDGVWETFDERGEQYGKDRLRTLLRAHHDSPASVIAAELEKDLAAFRGSGAYTDDVTFVIVKSLPAIKVPVS